MAKKAGKHKPKITPTDKPKKRIVPNEVAGALGTKVGDLALLMKPEQLKQLAGILHGTTQNVYSLCQRLFSVTVGDAIFDRLKKEEELFKCENCNEWMATDCMNDSIDICACRVSMTLTTDCMRSSLLTIRSFSVLARLCSFRHGGCFPKQIKPPAIGSVPVALVFSSFR